MPFTLARYFGIRFLIAVIAVFSGVLGTMAANIKTMTPIHEINGATEAPGSNTSP